MSKSKKALIAISALAILIVACVISYLLGFKFGIRSGGLASSMAEVMLSQQHMSDQMVNADCEGVRQAIDDHLVILERYRNAEGSLISDTIYYGDNMLAHVRLARIEQHMGNNREALKHMAKAKEACVNRIWKDCSEERLIWFAKRLEEKNPIQCLANEKD
jgi:hypothetical protein